MMRALAMAVLVVLAINLLLVAGVVTWLGATDRLSRERVDQIVAILSPTLEEERVLAEEAARTAETEEKKKQEAARLAAIAEAPTTLHQRLAEQDMQQQINAQLVDRLKAEARAIQQRLDTTKATVTQLKKQLEDERAAMEAFVAKHETQRMDEDFQEAVKFYEAMKPKQAKQSFMELIADGRTDSVIEYLSAMQQRKAGAVLREFKEPAEIAIATDLLTELKNRGLGQDEPVTSASGATP